MMTMAGKKEYWQVMQKRYGTCKTRREKSKIISEVETVLKVHRKSAIRILHGKQRKQKRLCVHPYIYGLDLIAPLKLMWELLGRPCSKRLQPEIPNLLKKLKQFEEITLYKNQEELLTKMSHWIIDNLLHDEKERLKIHGLTGTRRSPLLKSLIPIRTEFRNVRSPGHLEIDCVLHCGESVSGRYAETVNMLDIYTHWNEKRMIVNKTQGKVVATLHLSRSCFPFLVKSVDFDNRREFVNWMMHGYCKKNHISFTRSRPYRKNDQAHIEGKNYQSVRKITGYGRIVNEEIVTVFNDVYENEHRLLTNFFYPTLKLKSKRRKGSKMHKIYEQAKTPYQRVLESANIAQDVKDNLEAQYHSLNPMKLHQSLQRKLTHIQKLQQLEFNNNFKSGNVPTVFVV